MLVDLISIPQKNFKKRAKEILKFKPDYICIHTGIDEQNQGKKPFDNLKKISRISKKYKTKIAVAGGLNSSSIKNAIKFSPNIIIVGSAITASKNPAKIAKKLNKLIQCKK